MEMQRHLHESKDAGKSAENRNSLQKDFEPSIYAPTHPTHASQFESCKFERNLGSERSPLISLETHNALSVLLLFT